VNRFRGWIENGLAGAFVTGGAALVVIIFTGALGGLKLGLFGVVAAVLLAALFGAVVQGSVVRASAATAQTVVQPSGDTTKYTPTFSHIEALEIRGDLAGAERAWARACEEHPTRALVWIKAADFHLRLRRDAAAALPMYRAARDFPSTSPDAARYASQKIIDILLGQGGDAALADEGKAMGELRRLIERFPGTREAEAARESLARLKGERHGGESR